MVRYALYFLIIIIVADHIYTHYVPPLVNSIASFYEGRQVKVLEEDKDAKSLLDKIVDKVKENL